MNMCMYGAMLISISLANLKKALKLNNTMSEPNCEDAQTQSS